MSKQWLVRAGVMTAVHVGMRTALGFAALSWPTAGQLQRLSGLVVVVVVAAVWSGVDVLRENPDNENRDDLAVRWLAAAAVAGPLAGAIGWAVEAKFIDSVGTSELAGNLIGGGAFTALLIFMPALVGLSFGRLARADGGLRRSVRRQPSV